MTRLTIKDKDSKLRPLSPDDPFAWAQREFIKEVEYQHNQGKPIRIIVLKGRQLGISTVTEGLLFTWCFMFPGSNALVMSKDREGSENLFEMTKLMWDMWPYRSLFTTTRSSTRRLSWAETMSNFRVESAKGREVGRGSTLQAVHASEVAFWDNAEDLMPSLMNAIPNRHGTIVILESTANGVGGFFYDEWMKAVRGESEYTALFFPWFKHYEYTIRNTTLTQKQLSQKEKDLQQAYGLSLGQLAWRRRQIRLMNNDEDNFAQEYPCTWMEAFLSTGDNVFPLEALSDCYFPPGSDYLGQKVGMSRGYLVNDNGQLKFFKDFSGNLKVFKMPDPKKRYKYVVAADPSRTTTGDPCCIQVLNRTTLEQVAVWHGHLTTDDLAMTIANLGYWYNNATVNVEINGGGAGVIAVLIHMKYPWIWKWRRPDRPLNRLGNVFGWSTNMLTKPWGIGQIQHYLSKRSMVIHDDRTFNEMMEYTLLDGVEMGPASSSGTDDTVMALMIALMTNITEQAPNMGEIYGFDETPSQVMAGGYDEQQYREIDW
jgi:Terminase RNaseH-like domain